MIQFNLLPAVKVEYLKAKREQHLVVLVSTVASIAAVSVFVIFLSIVYGVQKKTLDDLNHSIGSASSQLQATPGLSQVLTVQNQLQALPDLDNSKVTSSRIYNYLYQITPSNASISGLTVGFVGSATPNTMVISGNADSLATINTFADTLKFTYYSVKGQPGQKKAFSEVVLTSFSVSSSGGWTYEISLDFDPVLFNDADTVTLNVPNIITTRSEIDQPAALFQPKSSTGSK